MGEWERAFVAAEENIMSPPTKRNTLPVSYSRKSRHGGSLERKKRLTYLREREEEEEDSMGHEKHGWLSMPLLSKKQHVFLHPLPAAYLQTPPPCLPCSSMPATIILDKNEVLPFLPTFSPSSKNPRLLLFVLCMLCAVKRSHRLVILNFSFHYAMCFTFLLLFDFGWVSGGGREEKEWERTIFCLGRHILWFLNVMVNSILLQQLCLSMCLCGKPA